MASDWTGSGRAWKALFAAIDARDAQRFAAFLTPDGVFRFGNSPPVRGRAAILAAVGGFFESIAGCHHELSRSWSGEGSVACEGAVTYTRHDGRQVTVPFANTFSLDGGQINCYRIYIDNAALYAP
jgi:ketosteroid isomerase-like protein